MQGTLMTGFEVSRFDECWFDMTPQAARALERAAPETRDHELHEYRIAIVANRAPPRERGAGYGHMSAYPCQVRATRIVSVVAVR